MPTAARRKCREIAAAATARRRALGLEGEGRDWTGLCPVGHGGGAQRLSELLIARSRRPSDEVSDWLHGTMESLVRSTRTELNERSFSRPRSFIHIRLLV